MYDKYPSIEVSRSSSECLTGWPEILERLRMLSAAQNRTVVCVECYPGVFTEELVRALREGLRPALIITAEESFLTSAEINAQVEGFLTDDPVFGRMNDFQIEDFLDARKYQAAYERIRAQKQGLILVIGTAASLLAAKYDVLVYADLVRWEIQKRQRSGEIGNLGADNKAETASLKYKRGFFLDWRAADRRKQELFPKIDFLLDTNYRDKPRMITGDVFRAALRSAVRRPFRLVPYFDPGPWGGHWMERVCGLSDPAPNHAWCFDCVPEENCLLFGFGEERLEVPAIDLVFAQPRELLGASVYRRFGAEFPIRFDFLDTMGGGNLSLQVHPLTCYIREKFGMAYTQDESYYLLDAEEDGSVYLGIREDTDPAEMVEALREAHSGKGAFNPELYVGKWPAKKHDHFLIPAGTIHCSGRNSMVLEISATPYIFTFKLWDWERMGLDGLPRPVHLAHGLANIQWERRTNWTKENLIGRVSEVACGEGWKEERTGLHELEFIETRRHWFTKTASHDTDDNVNVLNLVEGAEAVVESPANAFEPFVVHYAETFIVPAAVGAYTIRPHGSAAGTRCATIKAYVRQREGKLDGS